MEPGGWCGFVREAAVEAWPFAVAATNAYTGDHDVFAELGATLARLERLEIDADGLHSCTPNDTGKFFLIVGEGDSTFFGMEIVEGPAKIF